jgi:hypothetical protein
LRTSIKTMVSKISQFLNSIGHESSEVEPCAFRKVEKGMVYLLMIYIDDVLIIASAEEIGRFHMLCVDEFWWVAIETSRVICI